MSPPPSYFILLLLPPRFFALDLVPLSILLLCLSPFLLSLTSDMKHPFLPHEIWRWPSWIVYWLAACMPMAAGGQTQVFRQAAVGEWWWWQGGLAPPNMCVNLQGLIIMASSLSWGSLENSVQLQISCHAGCMYITPKCSYCQVCSIIMHTKINTVKPEMMTLPDIFPDSYPSTWVRQIIIMWPKPQFYTPE